jgi:tetraacyldisaccharide-1-P 4'-kinase
VAQGNQFRRDLEAQGFRVLKHFAFADHHVYTQTDLDDILTAFQTHRTENPILVTTDKDLTKVRSVIPEGVHDSVYSLQMQPALDGRWFYDEFLTQMSGLVQIGKHVHSSGHRH